jgi:hypothetical protein
MCNDWNWHIHYSLSARAASAGMTVPCRRKQKALLAVCPAQTAANDMNHYGLIRFKGRIRLECHFAHILRNGKRHYPFDPAIELPTRLKEIQACLPRKVMANIQTTATGPAATKPLFP